MITYQVNFKEYEDIAEPLLEGIFEFTILCPDPDTFTITSQTTMIETIDYDLLSMTVS